MDHLEVILPSLLLLVAFSYKLVVDKRFSFTEFIERCLEMPIEVVFLSGGFMIAFTLQDPSNHEFGLLSMFLGFFVSAIVFVLSKRSHEAFLQEKFRTCTFFALLSFFPATFTFIFCVGLLVP